MLKTLLIIKSNYYIRAYVCFKRFSWRRRIYLWKALKQGAIKTYRLEKAHHWRNWWKKLNNRYRLVIMNDDTFEEVAAFRLTRKGAYIWLCSVFVVLVALTVTVLLLTPLKYYIPGYGSQEQRQEYIRLNVEVDSLQNVVELQGKYLQDLKKVLRGDFIGELDTTRLKVSR